ncbi:MAG: VWA domain-containing protein [Acidobacteria bacterium]|nr:VWA domain-containing protein [Acidobacteriota bacterium]
MKKNRLPVWWLATLSVLLALVVLPLTGAQQPPSEQKQGPIQPKPREPQEEPYTLRVEAPLVSVDVVVTDRDGNFIPNLQKENFRIVEDGVEQTISSFAPSEAPLTTVMLLETRPQWYRVYYDMLDAAYLFLNRLRGDDYVALVGYTMRPEILVDFTRNKQQIQEALRRLEFPYGFREVNTYDALLDTMDRLKDVEGKRSIVLIGTGQNTFSRHSWDETVRRVREAESGVTVFVVSMAWAWQLVADRYDMTSLRMDLQVAEAQLKELAKQTGGRAYFPRFLGELPGVYEEVAAMLRNQYSMGYQPKEFKRDGKFHKIKVELVAPDGTPLKIVNQKGKQVKVNIYHRQGYYAPKEIEVADSQ